MQVSSPNKSQNADDNLLNNMYQMSTSSARLQCEVQMLNKLLERNNLIFQLQLQNKELIQKIDRLQGQLLFRDQKQRLLTIQKDLHESQSKTYKQKLDQIYLFIQQSRQQKKLLIQQYQKSQEVLRQKLYKMQDDYIKRIQYQSKNATQKLNSMQTDYKNIQQQLSKQKQKNKKLQQDIQQATQSFHTYLNYFEELKKNIRQKFLPLIKKQEGQQEIDDENQILERIKLNYQALQKQLKDISQQVKIQQRSNQYMDQQLLLRVQEIFKNYSLKILRKQKDIQDIQICINNILKSSDPSYQPTYGSQLISGLKTYIINTVRTSQQYQNKLDEYVNFKCQDCQRIKQQFSKYVQKYQKLNKQKVAYQQAYKKMKNDLDNEKKITGSQKKQLQDIKNNLQRSYTQQKLKSSRIQQQYQSYKSTNKDTLTKIQTLTEQKNQQIAKIVKKLKQIQQQKNKQQKTAQDTIRQFQARIDQLQIQKQKFVKKQKEYNKQIQDMYKQSQQRINGLNAQLAKYKKNCDQQSNKLRNYDNLEQNNRNITRMIDEIKNNLAIKTNQLDQVQQQLRETVNLVRKQRNQQVIQGQSYKQALSALRSLLQSGNGPKATALFKIPSLSQAFESNMNWVLDIISTYCQNNGKFETKFLGSVDENNKDYTKLLNTQTPNLLLIIQTSKQSIFCIFITKITAAIADTDPVVIFTPQKHLKYPSQLKRVRGTRPSMLNNQGMQFGKRQLAISKNLQMKITLLPTGYFGSVDTEAVFGSAVVQQVSVKKMEIYQVVF